MDRRKFIFTSLFGGAFIILRPRMVLAQISGEKNTGTIRVYSVKEGDYIMTNKVVKTEAEWKKILSPEQFKILRKQGTERAFTGKYWDNKEEGIYRCAGCGNDLFSSKTKFKSGTGWPSYWEPVAQENVETEDDFSFFTRRTEVHCARCDGHLGHIFEDGPPPTGLRYCINGNALDFVKKE
jgi:peptide-methionine (R)-S-oxide reductase